MSVEDWFLTADERGNPSSGMPAWFAGNDVRVHVHGASYLARLGETVEEMRSGDHLLFTDWRGGPDQRLGPAGPTVAELLSDASDRGVVVRGLVWRCATGWPAGRSGGGPLPPAPARARHPRAPGDHTPSRSCGPTR